ncbi:MAG: fused MFS/spermidine synthase [Legionellaceae bacterium]|nr:fused MFS/spermidine synthase [Legionellaceae bacterium]
MLVLLLAILLLEGFITISVEILTIRQLIPFYGNSVVITSIIIGIFLLFLALGYWRGGINRRNVFQCLSRNFLLSMLWIGCGLSYLFIALFFQVVVVYFSVPLILSLCLYLLLVLAPIVYWLGQTVPLTTTLFSQEKGVASISGSALFLSTVGSFLGAIVTSLIFFQYLGVAWTVVINAGLLFILAAGVQLYNKCLSWQMLLLGLILIPIKNLNVTTEQKLFVASNNYGNYQIVQTPKHRVFRINESNSSGMTSDQHIFAYGEFIRDVLFKQLGLNNKDILILGSGGFSLTAAGTNHNRVTYVDIDPTIKPLAEKYFLKQPINGEFIAQDARQFLNSKHTLYDVIISDVYSHKMAIPPSLLTREYFQQLSNHLHSNGLLIINVIAHPLFQDVFSQRWDNTVHSVFSHCVIVPLNFNVVSSNVIYICSKIKPDESVYTDNLNTATFDYFNLGIRR